MACQKYTYAVPGYKQHDEKGANLVVFLSRCLEHAISFGVGESIVERTVDNFVHKALLDISLGGSCLFVPIGIHMQNVVSDELLGAVRNRGGKQTHQRTVNSPITSDFGGKLKKGRASALQYFDFRHTWFVDPSIIATG